MSAQHTPGEWDVIELDGNCLGITGQVAGPDTPPSQLAYHNHIATVTQRDPHPQHGSRISRAMCRANARLISAAPDFLAACKDLIAYCDKNPPMGDSLWSVQCIRAAIAKAEGGAA